MKFTVQKYRRPSDFINQVFPDYIEAELTTSESGWLIIRLVHFFIAWIIKPKLKLKNFSDAKKLLSSVRRVQEGSHNMDDAEFNDALDMIVVKFLHDEKIISGSYISINQPDLLEKWRIYQVNPLQQFHCLDMDNLLHCLTNRISALQKSQEKKFLFCVLPALKDYVYKKDLLSFRNKCQEITNFLNKYSCDKNIEINQSIKNIFLKIIQRLCILNNESLANENIYLTNNLIKEKIEKIKFYYEAYRANWEKAYIAKGTTANYYEILNSLENVLYDVSFILDTNGTAENFSLHEIIEILQGKKIYDSEVKIFYDNHLGQKKVLENLFSVLKKIQNIVLQLKKFSENVILKNLSEDMITLGELISQEMSFLQTELETKIEEYNQIRFYDSDEEESAWDEEWDDDVSDTSEISNAGQLEQEDDLNRANVFITSMDNQSDSGISEHEAQNTAEQSRILTYDSKSAFFVTALSNEAINSGIVRNYFRNSYG